MTMEEKIKLCKAILLRIYKARRAEYKERHREPEWEERTFIVKDGAFVDFDFTQLTETILPYLKELGLLRSWGYSKEDEEFDFGFNSDVMEGLREPLENSKTSIKPEVEFNDHLGTLTYNGQSYKPTGELQKRAMRELWENRRDVSNGIKGEPVRLHTFGMRIRFDGIESATKFQMMLKDEKFEEKFRNFYKSIRKSVEGKMPVTINVDGNGILMTISEEEI